MKKEIEKAISQYKDTAPIYLEYLKTRGLSGDELALTLAKDLLESARISAIGAITKNKEGN